MGRKLIEIPRENEGFQRSWGCNAPRAWAESEARVAINMERKIIDFLKKMMDSRGPGGYAPRAWAESEARVALSMGRNIIEIHSENE